MEEKLFKILAVSCDQVLLNGIKVFIEKVFPNIVLLEEYDCKQAKQIVHVEKPSQIFIDMDIDQKECRSFVESIMSDATIARTPLVFIIKSEQPKKNMVCAFEMGADAFLHYPFDEIEMMAFSRLLLKMYHNNLELQNEVEYMESLLKKQVKKYSYELEKRKNFEDFLIRKESEFQEIYNSVSEAIIVIEAKTGKIIDCNNQAVIMFAYNDKKEILEGNILYLSSNIEQYTNEAVKVNYIEALKKGAKTFEWLAKKKNGDTFWVEASLKKSKIGEKICLLAVVRDINLRKEVQLKLIEQQELLNGMGRAAVIGGWNYNIETQKGNWTDEVFTIHEIEPCEEIGIDKILELYDTDEAEKLLQFMDEAIEKALPYSLELNFTTTSGNFKWVQIIGKPVLKNGKVVMLRGSIQDITGKKRMINDLIVAKERAEESDRLKSAFLANMSHEIRTPMNSIMGFASLLPEEESRELMINYANIIVRSSEQLVHIIDDIVLYSRLQTRLLSYIPSKFVVRELLFDVKQMFNLPEYQIGVKLIVKPGDLLSKEIVTDYEKLRQVITNLVSNAFKYTLSGSIAIGYTRRKNMEVFFVKDTGIGIPAGEEKKVFERFYRGSNVNKGQIGGTGLGLSIVQELVELIHGRIWIESEINKGTAFYFTVSDKK